MAELCCCGVPFYQAEVAPKIGSGSGGTLIQSHKIEDIKVTGQAMQLVEFMIPPGQCVIGETGCMAYYKEGIEMKAMVHDGSSNDEMGLCAKCRLCCCSRSCTGESGFVVHYENSTGSPVEMGMAWDMPGQLVPIDLSGIPQNFVFAMSGAYFAAVKGVHMKPVRDKCCSWTCCCAGMGWCFQKIEGNGLVWLAGGGTLEKVDMRNEKHTIDSTALVAFTPGLKLDFSMKGVSCYAAICGGEGIGFTTLEGTGSYWISSSSLQTQISAAVKCLPPKN